MFSNANLILHNRHAAGIHFAGSTMKDPPLYSGKWTLEEEQFVAYLSEEFKAGAADIPEGKSLRCYLADQLGCNAKRISKKYERTGYNGKLQYVDKRATMTAEELQKRKQRRDELQRKFKESRETLKLVLASRKRPEPNPNMALASPEPAHKKPKTVLLTPVTPRMVASSPLGLHILGGGIEPTSTGISIMDSLLVRRALLARQHQANDLIRASMLSPLQKHGPAQSPHHLSTHTGAGDLKHRLLNASAARLLATQKGGSY